MSFTVHHAAAAADGQHHVAGALGGVGKHHVVASGNIRANRAASDGSQIAPVTNQSGVVGQVSRIVVVINVLRTDSRITEPAGDSGEGQARADAAAGLHLGGHSVLVGVNIVGLSAIPVDLIVGTTAISGDTYFLADLLIVRINLDQTGLDGGILGRQSNGFRAGIGSSGLAPTLYQLPSSGTV